MISCPGVTKAVIRHHYDFVTLFYWLFWGRHIHHGLWEGDESPRVAQEQLMSRLAKLAELRSGAVVYDIGCGMGGSSQWLAQSYGCHATGVTISPVQARWATMSSRMKKLRPSPGFRCEDAESIDFPVASADFLWSIECTEHLFDKPTFFRRAATWLKPGGRFALCAWLCGAEPLGASREEQVLRVCEGMFCPSLGSEDDYGSWFEQAGMKVIRKGLWTSQVQRTWEICLQRVKKSKVRYLAKLFGKDHVLFLDHFEAILNAYRTGAMEYGYFVAEKQN